MAYVTKKTPAKIMAVLVLLAMLLTMLPLQALAANLPGQDDLPQGVSLRVEYLDETYIPAQEVTISEFKTLEAYGVEGATEAGYVTPLHILAQWMEDTQGEDPANIAVNGSFVNNINDALNPDKSEYFMFKVNNEAPVMADGYTQYTIADYPVENGDEIVIYATVYPDTEAYAFFESSTYDAVMYSPFTVTLQGEYTNADWTTEIRPVSDAELLVSEVDGKTANTSVGVTTDSQGQAKLYFNEEGTYVLSARKGSAAAISRPYGVVNVTAGNDSENQSAVEAAKQALTIPDVTEGDPVSLLQLELTAYGEEDTVITWQSDNEAVIDGEGLVTRPALGEEDAAVNLTATIHKGNAIATKVFALTVKAVSTEENDNDQEWRLFRGGADNNGVTQAATPQHAGQANLKWLYQLTAGWDNSSNVVIADDAIFMAVKDKLYRFSKEGQVMGQATLSAALVYNSYMAYSNGKLFISLNNGVIEAVDAATMTTLWISQPTAEGHMASSPILVQDGMVYTGSSEGWSCKTGNYFALDAATGEIKWNKPSEGKGYYWAGAVAVGDVLVYGNDDGLVLSVDKTTGDTIDEYQADGPIRSTVVSTNGTLYFTTKNGTLYAIQVNNDGTFVEANVKSVQICKDAIESTSTPVVVGGRVYAGAKTANNGGALGVVDAVTMTQLYTVPLRANGQGSPLVSTQDGVNYVYMTYNGKPGGITVIQDDLKHAPQSSELFTPDASYQNFCITSVVADSEGALYYKNDSNYLFAIGKQQTADQALAVFNVQPTGATVTIMDSNDQPVVAVADGSYALAAGSYRYTASLAGYRSKSGELIISTEQAAAGEVVRTAISLSKETSGDSDNITVTFRLTGDTLHGEGGKHSNPTWIASRQVTVPAGSTVFDVFDKVLTEVGMGYDESSYGYIGGIQSPAGEWLYQLDNGPLSGWMFTYNGKHGLSSLREQTLKNGDRIIWHYSDDYTKEEGSERFNGSSGGGATVSADGILSYNQGGKVTPVDLKDSIGKDVEFTFTADAGYRIKDVLIDGVSIGAVSSYTYKNLKKDSSVQVIFEKSPAVRFTDVPQNHWAATYIELLASKGIVNGKTETTFGPEDAITRAEFLAILARLSGERLPAADDTFQDVSASAWYAPAVAWATQAAITNGTSATTFAPNDSISRQDLAVMLQRYSAYRKVTLPAVHPVTAFIDQDAIAGYALQAVTTMQQAGILSGDENGAFAPVEQATRAEAVKMIAMWLELE